MQESGRKGPGWWARVRAMRRGCEYARYSRRTREWARVRAMQAGSSAYGWVFLWGSGGRTKVRACSAKSNISM